MGVAVHDDRLYYAVAEGPEIWSVGINATDGAFLYDARLELALPRGKARFEISDIAFAEDGSMILAQRGEQIGSFDFTRMSRSRRAEVMRFHKKMLNGKPTGKWEKTPTDYAVGFAHNQTNTTGGVALGPGYDELGRAVAGSCGATLWTSGEALRNEPDLETALLPGGALKIDGVQAQPLALSIEHNSPPWISKFVDFDGRYPEERQSGQVGDVEIAGCQGGNTDYAYDYGDDLPLDPSIDWWACLLDPRLCQPPERKACLKTRHQLVCNKKTGNYELQIVATDDLVHDFDRLSVKDYAGLLTIPADNNPFPTNITLPITASASGQIGQLQLCTYNGDAKARGEPFDCCRAQVTFRIPVAACEKGVK